MTKKKTLAAYLAEAHQECDCLVHPVIRVARKIYLMRHGDLPSHLFVCHTCDNPYCIADEHHFVGANKDNMQDAARKGRLSPSRIGRYVSEETRMKKSKSMMGHVVSAETRLKISAANKGHVISDASKEKMRNAKLGTKQSNITTGKRSASLTGKPRSAEACMNISIGKTGKKFTEEHKTALKEAWKIRKQKKEK